MLSDILTIILYLFVNFLIFRSFISGRFGVNGMSMSSFLINEKTLSTGRARYDARAEKIT